VCVNISRERRHEQVSAFHHLILAANHHQFAIQPDISASNNQFGLKTMAKRLITPDALKAGIFREKMTHTPRAWRLKMVSEGEW
jgi:hypothetical protein